MLISVHLKTSRILARVNCDKVVPLRQYRERCSWTVSRETTREDCAGDQQPAPKFVGTYRNVEEALPDCGYGDAARKGLQTKRPDGCMTRFAMPTGRHEKEHKKEALCCVGR
jgi:hypothetical protein